MHAFSVVDVGKNAMIFIVILNILILSVIMLSIIMLSIIMLGVPNFDSVYRTAAITNPLKEVYND